MTNCSRGVVTLVTMSCVAKKSETRNTKSRTGRDRSGRGLSRCDAPTFAHPTHACKVLPMASMQNPTSELSPAMQQCSSLLETGKTVEAEETVLRAAAAARAKSGKGSRADSIAESELGSVLQHIGQLDRAIDAFRESVSGPARRMSRAWAIGLRFS